MMYQIAAKLNTYNVTGVPIIDEVESWMGAQGLVHPDGSLDWDKPFDSLAQRETARGYILALHRFMRVNTCR